MSVKLSKIKKIENYAEYRADFVGFAPVATTNETTVDVHFISTRAVPAIINEGNESDSHNEDAHIVKEKTLQIGSTNELVHSCTVTMPLVQLKGLREAIDSLLLQLEQQKQK
ncbi:hypothetical protein I5M99_06245 [Serratia marcescens]|nr:hypothetical protein [Serratia marcescens]